MKRIIAVLFVVAFAFTTLSGCACVEDANKCKELCQAALDKAQQVEQSCASYAKQAEAAAMKAEAAARRAEAAADKCENIFMKKMKK
jgi:outer membrane murein-binding lipoprotein Lpp